MPQPNTISKIEAERVADILSEREGTCYKFSRFLNLSRFSLVFVSDTGEQRVLAGDNIKQLLKESKCPESACTVSTESLLHS